MHLEPQDCKILKSYLDKTSHDKETRTKTEIVSETTISCENRLCCFTRVRDRLKDRFLETRNVLKSVNEGGIEELIAISIMPFHLRLHKKLCNVEVVTYL